MNSWKMPNGIYELSGKEALNLEFDKRRLVDLYVESKYQLLIPPPINFASHGQSFKFSDSQGNKMLEIVADVTKQVAIIDSKLSSDSINKYCYCNQIIKPQADDFYSSRMPMQVGCEIYGDSSLSADLDVVATMITSLKLLGLEQINISIGNLAILNSAIDFLNLGKFKKELTDIFKKRSNPDLLEFIANNNISKCEIQLLSLISGNSIDIAKEFNDCPDVIKQIQKTIDFKVAIERSETNAVVTLDLADNNAYSYHNGLIFSAYSDGFSKAIARGGRYDSSLNSRHATGFSFDLCFITSKQYSLK